MKGTKPIPKYTTTWLRDLKKNWYDKFCRLCRPFSQAEFAMLTFFVLSLKNFSSTHYHFLFGSEHFQKCNVGGLTQKAGFCLYTLEGDRSLVPRSFRVCVVEVNDSAWHVGELLIMEE